MASESSSEVNVRMQVQKSEGVCGRVITGADSSCGVQVQKAGHAHKCFPGARQMLPQVRVGESLWGSPEWSEALQTPQEVIIKAKTTWYRQSPRKYRVKWEPHPKPSRNWEGSLHPRLRVGPTHHLYLHLCPSSPQDGLLSLLIVHG